MSPEEYKRQEAKSRQQRFLNQMIHDFNYPPKIAQAILNEAEECLFGLSSQTLLPGQMRVNLLPRTSPHGQALNTLPTIEVVWTLNDEAVDGQVRQAEGVVGLRQHRVQRLFNEAIEQGALATQEDVAAALQVSVRTIKRDCQALRQQGILLPTRGHIKQIGRGQTHKAQIVGRWLDGASYDQIARQTHHSVVSVRRYIQTFVRVTQLLEKGFSSTEVSLVLQMTPSMVQQYEQLLANNKGAFEQERLQEQLHRLAQTAVSEKKRAA